MDDLIATTLRWGIITTTLRWGFLNFFSTALLRGVLFLNVSGGFTFIL